MMRGAARAIRHARYCSQIRREFLYGLNGSRKVSTLREAAACSLSGSFVNKKISGYLSQTLRALSTSAESDSAGVSADVGRSGPLVEYERRIASGELVDGDAFQVGAIFCERNLPIWSSDFWGPKEVKMEKDQKREKKIFGVISCIPPIIQGSNWLIHLGCFKDSMNNLLSMKKAVSWIDIRHLKNLEVSSCRSRWLWSRLIPQSSYSPVKGLYLYGGVGTGKTMLMDLFFDQLPCNWRKRRRHFHDFMLDVHRRLQMHKGVADPLELVAGEISDGSILLCLDEFMVTDVADALILNRLFKHLFSKGIVLVSTSNRSPDHLYEGGLQRDLFLPFIDTLKERCIVHEIGSSTDYRKLTSAEQGFYFIGDNPAVLMQRFFKLIGKATPRPQVVEVVMGRQLQVPLGANGCAYFSFVDLCDKPLGAADYLGLVEKFHTVALDGVPKFGTHNRSAAYRFVTLVDVMYENKARLLCTAQASPTELFEKIVTVADAQRISPRSSSRSRKVDDVDLCVDNELGFAKERTISRLTEMNSREYIEQHEARIARLLDKARQDVGQNVDAKHNYLNSK